MTTVTSTSGISGIFARFTAHRDETAERRRIERELASFTTESEKAELSAILERHAAEADTEIRGMISDRVLATTEHHAA
jgi:hypothetical protein